MVHCLLDNESRDCDAIVRPVMRWVVFVVVRPRLIDCLFKIDERGGVCVHYAYVHYAFGRLDHEQNGGT